MFSSWLPNLPRLGRFLGSQSVDEIRTASGSVFVRHEETTECEIPDFPFHAEKEKGKLVLELTRYKGLGLDSDLS